MDINALLNQVNSIRQKYDEIYRNTGAYFNIFSIAKINDNEKIICRIIKELLDPKGSHYQGAIYLKLFLKLVLEIDEPFTNEALENTIVEREKLIANNRRIDLFISIPGRMMIPIEVKIYANDQELQCHDYYQYASDKLYYLTLDGHDPSDESMRDLDSSRVKNISFEKEIITWLNECLKLTETIRLAPIREIILQFIAALQTLTNQAEDRMEKEVLKLILETKDNYKTAERIGNTLKAAEEEILYKVFKAIDRKIVEKYPFISDPDRFQEMWNEYGGLYYPVTVLDDVNGTLYLNVIKYNHKLYTSLDLCDEKVVQMDYQEFITTDSILTGTWDSSNVWIAMKPLGDGILDELPKLKNHNDAFYNLLDPDYFDTFIESAMKTIDELMTSLK